MFDTLILLTGPVEYNALSSVLRFRNPSLEICHVSTLDELNVLDADLLMRSRLVAFATATIVPRAVLELLGYGAYNFHPGPPQYPGWAPCSFAVYERAAYFGATAHLMVEKVDAGPIVGVQLFPISPETTVAYLDELALIMLARLFWNLAEALTTQETPLTVLPIHWGGPKRSKRDYRAMCDAPEGITPEDLERRVAAFGRGDYGCDLTVTVHGQRFRYVAPPTEGAQESAPETAHAA